MHGRAPEKWNEAGQIPEIPQRFNVAPTTGVPMVRILRDSGGAELEGTLARWGLIPQWFRKPLKEWKASTINARAETVATAPSYRDAYKSARCIVPMAGYYEWATLGDDRKRKQAYYIHPAGNAAGLLVAAIWSEVDIDGYKGLTCSILTEPSVGEMATIHDRQPVIVDAEGATLWMSGCEIEDLPRQDPKARAMRKVSGKVGSVRNEGPDLLWPDPQKP